MASGKPPDQAEAEVSEQNILRIEKAKITLCRARRLGSDGTTSPWCGIGLSGGGIRSASLALGVMQALAEHDLLKRFDYLSTVSGGGYLGGSLQWWWSRRPREDTPSAQAVTFGLGPRDFPYGPALPVDDDAADAQGSNPEQLRRAERNLAFLRAHSSYLIPGDGVTAWSMLGVVLRTVVISLFIWIPLLVGCLSVVGLLDSLAENTAHLWGIWSPLGGFITSRWQAACDGPLECDLRFPIVYALALYCFYGVCLLFVVAALFFALLSRAPQDRHGSRRWVVRLIGVICVAVIGEGFLYRNYSSWDGSIILLMAAGAILICVAAIIIWADLRTPPSLNSSYWLRRTLERRIGQAFLPSLVILAIATIPILPHYLQGAAGSSQFGVMGAIVGLFSGVYSALYGYYTFLRNVVPSLIGQIMATVGAVLYLYATLVMAYVLSVILLHAVDLQGVDVTAVRLMLMGLIVLAVVLGLWANINYVGLHRFYRDRLMEAFMPADSAVSDMRSSYSPVADELSMLDLRDSLECDPADPDFVPRPFLIINTNAIMINDRDHKVATRGGDNFIITPLFVGSSVTGWQDTEDYIAKNGPFTLASAVAASGAAANASAGYIGTGITMNPLVSAVMSLLNIRLGLWIGNPYHRKPRRVRSIPHFLNPGLVSGIFGRAHNREASFIELTDGGHFENLGLYELVRRKLSVILIVDGEADPTISLQALVSATRRIEQDFEARLTFFEGFGPERLVMYPGQGYPAGVRYAQSPFIVGKLLYGDGSEGTLILVKATVIKQMDFTTAGYLASNPDFPHQATEDQFFNADQFDAYRLLGYESGSQTINGLQLAKTITDPEAIIAQYRAAKATSAHGEADHTPAPSPAGDC